MRDMTITFTDSVETASFDTADGSIEINLKWWGSLPSADKALIIIHELQALTAWRGARFNTPADYVINPDALIVLDELPEGPWIGRAPKRYSR